MNTLFYDYWSFYYVLLKIVKRYTILKYFVQKPSTIPARYVQSVLCLQVIFNISWDWRKWKKINCEDNYYSCINVFISGRTSSLEIWPETVWWTTLRPTRCSTPVIFSTAVYSTSVHQELHVLSVQQRSLRSFSKNEVFHLLLFFSNFWTGSFTSSWYLNNICTSKLTLDNTNIYI